MTGPDVLAPSHVSVSPSSPYLRVYVDPEVTRAEICQIPDIRGLLNANHGTTLADALTIKNMKEHIWSFRECF